MNVIDQVIPVWLLLFKKMVTRTLKEASGCGWWDFMRKVWWSIFNTHLSLPPSLICIHTHTRSQSSGRRALCGILAKEAEIAARKVSMMAQKVWVQALVWSTGSSVWVEMS